jgi:glycosyltransferase involved in cell wall biosynthesis
MNILLLWPFIHPNLYPVLDSLKEFRFKVTLLIDREPIHSYELTNKYDYILAESILNVENFILEQKPDVVILRMRSPLFLKLLKEAKCQGAQTFLFDLRTSNTSNPRKYLSRFCKSILNYLRYGTIRLITPLRGTGVRMPFSYYLPFPTDCTKYKNKVYIKNSIPQLIVCGKLFRPRKRIEWVIDAINDLSIKCKIVIVGASFIKDCSIKGDIISDDEIYYNNLMRKINLGLKAAQIELIENCNHDKMFDLYNSSDVFVLPARGEPLGISPLEAMSCGCSVLVSDRSGIASYVIPNKTGFLFKENSFEDFKSKLKLLLDTTLLESRGKYARQVVLDKYCSQSFIQNFKKIIKLKK